MQNGTKDPPTSRETPRQVIGYCGLRSGSIDMGQIICLPNGRGNISAALTNDELDRLFPTGRVAVTALFDRDEHLVDVQIQSVQNTRG